MVERINMLRLAPGKPALGGRYGDGVAGEELAEKIVSITPFRPLTLFFSPVAAPSQWKRHVQADAHDG